jgi:pimeloyl-ACP methyl ester carboxylesterase
MAVMLADLAPRHQHVANVRRMSVGFPEPRMVTLPDRGFGAIDMAVHELGDGPAVVFSHGFPELAYSWRHQLPATAAAGFRAVAPDQRGYGDTTAPRPIEAYAIDELCGDLAALCDALDVERAVFVGHDWGGAVVWAMPTLHPDRVAGIVGVCTPSMAFPGTDFLEMLVDGDVERQYMLWFQEPGVAEAVLDPRAALLFEKLMVGGIDPSVMAERAFADGKLDMNPFRDLEGLESIAEPCVPPDEVAHYAEVFGRTGFRGGINWYRNLDRNRETHPEIGTGDPGVPCLMICAEWDPALPPALAAGMPDRIADLEMLTIPKVGHWVQQEAPDAVNAALVDWLSRRFG